MRSRTSKPVARDSASATSRKSGRTAVRLVERETRRQESPPGNHIEVDNPPETARRRRGDDVRERVLQAALECFGAFGFEGTSTRAVAERAKVTHTLVLYHFQSKDQLWIATMEATLNRYMAEMKANFDSSGQRTAQSVLRIFIEQFVRMSARQPQVHRILTMESNQGTARLNWVIAHYLRRHYTLVRDLILRGQAEGSVRQCDPARLYYHIIGPAERHTQFRMNNKALTGRDVFSEPEILRNIAFIHEIVFI